MSEKSLADILSRYGHAAEFAGINLVDPNQQGIFGARPLGVAATFGDLNAIKILLGAGAEIDAKGEDGYTPLHDAVAHGQKETTRYLLEQGASATVLNDNGETPRELAVSLHRDDIIILLDEIESGHQ